MGIQNSETAYVVRSNLDCEVPKYEATEVPSRTQMTCLQQFLRQMRSVKFFFLVSYTSFVFSLLWVQLAIWQDQPAVPHRLIQEALKNGRSNRYKNVYSKMDKVPKYFKYILLWSQSELAPLIYLGNGQKAFLENKCSMVNCYVTANRSFFGSNLTKFDAIAFNGRNMKPSNLPRIRSRHQKYIYFNMESSDMFPVCSQKFDGFFNWTATYRLDSDIPFPYIQIRNTKGDIVGPIWKMRWMGNMKPVRDEFDERIGNKTKAAAWFVSRCKTRSYREGFVEALKTALLPYGFTVDIYGKCGTLKYSKNKESDLLDRDYFFYMSLENSFSEDYVTEKLLRAMQHDVVPIVYGGADYSRFLPPGSYIDGQAQSINHLAGIMDALMHNPKEYSQYFRWKRYYTYHNPSGVENVCALCEALHNSKMVQETTIYDEFRKWWNPNYKTRCSLKRLFTIRKFYSKLPRLKQKNRPIHARKHKKNR